MWKYKPTHPASALRLCSLPLRPGWSFQPETAETVRKKLTTKKDTHTEDSAHLGSSWLELPLPYSGITFSLLMPALHTGHCCRLGRVSNHWWGGAEQGEGCQNDCNTRHTNRSLFADSRVEPKCTAFSKTLFTARDVKHNMFTVVSGEGSGSKRRH